MLIVFVLEVKTKPKGEKLNLKKKGIIALASTLTLAGVVAVTPFMLTGCSNGKDGSDGRDGTIWKSGTTYTQFTDAKVGDYFIDTDVYRRLCRLHRGRFKSLTIDNFIQAIKKRN